MEQQNQKEQSFFARLSIGLACLSRALGSSDFCQQASVILRGAPVAKPVELPPERVHASGLLVFSMLQREGRLVDFLQEDVASFSDADVGAAARVVHAGCRKALAQCLTLEPVTKESEGAAISIPAGFDAQRIRLTGNVTGQPPFRGALKHHGWVATAVKLPAVAEALDPRVIAPAEVELA